MQGSEPPAKDAEYDFPILIAAMPATAKQRKAALGVVGLLLGVAVLVAPFAQIQAAQIDNFIPVLQTVLSVADLTTATLLFTQYSIQSQPAILVLASGYVFSGSFAFLQTLAFPGGYAPAGVIGDGRNSAAWLFVLWHATYLGAVLIYTLSKDMGRRAVADSKRGRAKIGATIACVLVGVALLTSTVTEGVEYLPKFYIESVTSQTRLGNQVNWAFCLTAAAALFLLFLRRRTVLDLWLMVTLVAWIPNFLAAAVATSVRFSFGWYTARGFALIASCVLLSVLVAEMTFLYSRLASALILQRRERGDRLMSVEVATAAMAHELRTPLGAIVLNASAALSQLRATPPDLRELDAILEDIEAAGHRAGTIISSVRALSAKLPIDRRMPTNMGELTRQVLKLTRHELQINEIEVVTQFEENIPPVLADPVQLQQLILNLVKNAIDAMSFVATDARLLRLEIRFEGRSRILLSIRDSGRGIAPADQDRIFEPFFTTKVAGMGLGLSICRAIIENHGGNLRLAKSDSRGSTLEIALPVGE